MSDSTFDVALEKRFTDSTAAVAVTSLDTLLVYDVETGAIFKLPVSVLTNAINAAAPVQSVAGKTGNVTLNKSDVGLSNVDNTSDANKPVSTAQATAIAAKEPSIAAGTTAQYWRGDKSWQTLNKAAVGLSNVDNTSDASKPVSTAQQTALNAKANAAQSAWIAPTLNGAWVNFGGAYETAGYLKDNFGFVHLKGLVKTGTGVIFNLPVGYRPSEEKIFATIGNGTLADVRVGTNGDVSMYSGNSSYLSLSGIVFQL